MAAIKPGELWGKSHSIFWDRGWIGPPLGTASSTRGQPRTLWAAMVLYYKYSLESSKKTLIKHLAPMGCVGLRGQPQLPRTVSGSVHTAQPRIPLTASVPTDSLQFLRQLWISWTASITTDRLCHSVIMYSKHFVQFTTIYTGTSTCKVPDNLQHEWVF